MRPDSDKPNFRMSHGNVRPCTTSVATIKQKDEIDDHASLRERPSIRQGIRKGNSGRERQTPPHPAPSDDEYLRPGSPVMIFCMPRFPGALCLSVMVGTLTPQAKAQTCGANAQSPIATDRPQITSSSIVVPCGSLQFENGFQETSNGGQRSFDFP